MHRSFPGYLLTFGDSLNSFYIKILVIGVNLHFPDLEKGKEKRTKDYILEFLSDGTPKSVRQIYGAIVNKHGLSVTYQAVHKAILLMVNERILEKTKDGFLINIGWLNQLEEFAKSTKKNVGRKSGGMDGVRLFKEGDTVTTIVFETYGGAEEYRKKLQFEYFAKKGKKAPYCGQSYHLKSPIIYSEKTLESMERVKQTKLLCYLLVNGTTPFDEFCAHFYRNFWIKVKTGASVAQTCDTMIIGDIVTQVYVPDEIRKLIDKKLNTLKQISDISIPDFYEEIMKKKVATKLVILRNPELAEQIRQQTIFQFKERLFIFDLDGVLIDGILVTAFAEFLAERKEISRKNLGKMLAIKKTYDENPEDYPTQATRLLTEYAGTLKGKAKIHVSVLAKEFVRSNKLRLQWYTENLLQFSRQHGKSLILTGAPQELAEALKEILPIDHVVGSEFETKDGLFSGKLQTNLALAEKKRSVLETWLEQNPVTIDNSFGFGDTLQDIPILERVKYPIVVNPERGLEKYAKGKGWHSVKSTESPLKTVQKVLEHPA